MSMEPDDEGIVVYYYPPVDAYRVLHVSTGVSVDVPAHRVAQLSGTSYRPDAWALLRQVAKDEARRFLTNGGPVPFPKEALR